MKFMVVFIEVPVSVLLVSLLFCLFVLFLFIHLISSEEIIFFNRENKIFSFKVGNRYHLLSKKRFNSTKIYIFHVSMLNTGPKITKTSRNFIVF